MKVLIDTNCLKTIEGDILLHLQDAGYRLVVKEVGLKVHVIQKVDTNTSRSSSMEASYSDGVVGFEDVDDDVAKQDEMAAIDKKGNDMEVEEGADKAVKNPSNFKINHDS